MPSPLTPSSSQEIVPISAPLGPHASSSKIVMSSKASSSSSSATLPKARGFSPDQDLKEKIVRHVKAYNAKVEVQGGKRKARASEAEGERRRAGKMDRGRMTERMMSTLGKEVNPITNSDLYTRTDHFVSAATGHQQSNRGGGSTGAKTYWEVRTAKSAEQAREKQSDLFRGCLIYINGSTGPRVSNLQLQHMITQNGGRFAPLQNSSCTHVIASGGLSGSKTQKWIDGQGGRSGLKRMKIVRADWVIDSVEQGKRLSETGYGVIENPTQKNLFAAFGIQPASASSIPEKESKASPD